MQVDPRTGSDRLFRQLKGIRGLPVESGRLEYGDVSFIGAGPEGRPVPVGIEYKVVSDVLSCITDGRFAGHQLPGLKESYEIVVLLMEGVTRPSSPDGVLEIQHPVKRFWYKGKIGARVFMHRELANWLNTLTFKAGVRVMRSADLAESAALVHALYSWWTSGWDGHKSHLALHSPVELEQVNFSRPTLVRRWASCLPNIGLQRSGAVARRFRTPIEMALADEADWREIEGVGRETARRVVEAIQTGKEK